MGAFKKLELNELDLEKLKNQLLITEIRKIADSVDEILHRRKYYDDPITPEAIEKIYKRLADAARDFA